MKREQLEKFIKDNRLLGDCLAASGIYGITINNRIVYVGQSKNVYQRCSQHIYNIQNAMLNNEKKYLFLLAAQLGGYTVDCHTLAQCKEEQLTAFENEYIENIKPMLNILTPYGKQDISQLTIGDLLINSKYDYIFGNLQKGIV